MSSLVIGGWSWGRVWVWMTAGIQPAKSGLTEREREEKNEQKRESEACEGERKTG